MFWRAEKPKSKHNMEDMSEFERAASAVLLLVEDVRGGAKQIDLSAANFRGADMRMGYFQDANLQGANLQGANLQGADLQGADLRDVNHCASTRYAAHCASAGPDAHCDNGWAKACAGRDHD